MRWLCVAGLLAGLLASEAAELVFDFGTTSKGGSPEGFKAILAGEGRPGSWAVVRATVPSALETLSAHAPQTSIRPVLTQTDTDPTDERFPMLVYSGEEFGDFTLTTRIRILGGEKEQMAGVAFRLQDERNFYVVRVSALGQNVRFYKVAEGLRGRIIGPSIPVATNEWIELSVRCQGNEIFCSVNGSLVMPPLQDTSFSKGRVAFWTKSDSVCQFDGARITYTPTIPISRQLLDAALKKYSRVIDLRLYTPGEGAGGTTVVAGKDPEDVGQAGGEAELGALQDGNSYVGKSEGRVTVVMPVRDRNGDPVVAARVVMESFPGQTDNNALIRARPIVELMEKMILTTQDPIR